MTIPPRPDITVIVIAQLQERTLDDAVRSVLDQAHQHRCEIVIVANGQPALDATIARSPTVKVIETATRLLPGAARNVGVREAKGEIVAFLAADCRAEPGWIDRRIALHKQGIGAVASAVTHSSRTPAGWASYYSLFPSRLPGRRGGFVTHRDPAAHGLSYQRALLSALGPFDERLRIGEDSDMAALVIESGATIWFEPSVRIAHIGPEHTRELISDHYRRGLRSGANPVPGTWIRADSSMAPWSRLWLKRARSVLRRAWRNAGRERWRVALVAPWILLGVAAYHRGWIRSIRSPRLAGETGTLQGTVEAIPADGEAPVASVVVPFRHDGAVLAQALDGLSAQQVDFPFEVIVVDSSPGGDAGSFVQSGRAAAWSRLEIVRSPVGLRPGEARNKGIEAARGGFVAFLAADCIPAPSWLARRVHRHRQGFTAVAGAIECASPRGLPQIVQWLVRFGPAYPTRTPRTHRVPRFGWSYLQGDLTAGFRGDLPASEDRVFNESLLAGGARVIFDPAIRTAHIGLSSLAEVMAHQQHHGSAAARLAERPETRHLVSRYGGTGFRLWYGPLRWLRGIPSAAGAGPSTLARYLVTAPWQVAAHRAWAAGFVSRLGVGRLALYGPHRGWIVEEFGKGGIARYAVDVANLLGDSRAVTVATTTTGGAPGLRPPHGVEPWFPSRRAGPLDRIRAGVAGSVRAALRPRRGDWAWVQLGIRPLFELTLVTIFRMKGIRVVSTLHNRAPHEQNRPSPVVRLAARRSEKVIVHSKALQEWCGGLGLPVLHLPFPVPNVMHSGPARRYTRASLGLDENDVVLLSFGNLRPYKGIDDLIRALLSATTADPEIPIRLILAGQARVEDESRFLPVDTGATDRIKRVVGYLEDGEIADLLAIADAAAFPYRRIDHSGSAVLAAAHGLPAIAGNLPTLRELFDGRAIFVTPGSVPELTQALLDLPAFLSTHPRLDADGRPSRDTTSSYRSFAADLWNPR